MSAAVCGAARSYGDSDDLPAFNALSIVFNPKTKLIDLTQFEERRDISSGPNERIKQFYWKLWFGDNDVLPNIDIHKNFVGPDAAINSSDVEQFCAVAGNQEKPSRWRGTTTSSRSRGIRIILVRIFFYLNISMLIVF